VLSRGKGEWIAMTEDAGSSLLSGWVWVRQPFFARFPPLEAQPCRATPLLSFRWEQIHFRRDLVRWRVGRDWRGESAVRWEKSKLAEANRGFVRKLVH
jgi:hypothetical protein